MKIDLHIHTTFSDGGEGIQKIFDIANKNGVKILSITDHTNIDAYNFFDAIDTHNIQVLRGMEVDVEFENLVVHILIYNFHLNDAIKNYLKAVRDFDIKEFRRMVNSCEKTKNVLFDKKILENFIKNNQYFDKVRLNNLLVQAGFATSPVEAFYSFTKEIDDKKRYIVSADEFFKIAKASNGQTFIAHPAKYLKDLKTMENLEKYILKLKSLGLNGVEIYNNRQTLEQQSELLTFSKNNNLQISGGSDYHAKYGGNEKKEIGKVLNFDIESDLVSHELFRDLNFSL